MNKREQVEADAPGPMKLTRKLGEQYEKMRIRFLKAGGDVEASAEAKAVATQMQDIEAQFYDIWHPHRELVGACPKCRGVRMPIERADQPGFGCLNCKNFELLAETPGL